MAKYKADPEYKALPVIQTPCRLFARTPPPPFPFSTQLYSAPRSIPQVYVAVPQSSVLFFATNSGLNRGNLANAGDKLMSQALCDSDRAFFATIEDCCCREAEDFLIFSISSSSPSLFKVIVVFKQVGNKFGTREPQAISCAYKWR